MGAGFLAGPAPSFWRVLERPWARATVRGGMAEPFDADDEREAIPEHLGDWLDVLALDLIEKGKRLDGKVFEEMVERGLAFRNPAGEQAMTRLGRRVLDVSKRTSQPGNLQQPGPFPKAPDALPPSV